MEWDDIGVDHARRGSSRWPAAALREGLAAIPGVTVRDVGAEKCAIVTFTVDGKEPEDVKCSLAASKINVTVTAAIATRLDLEARGLDRMVRASVHYYNTDEEIERFCEAVAGV